MSLSAQRRILAVLFLLAAVPSASASPLQIPDTELEPLDFSKLDRWAADDLAAPFATFRKSCDAVVKRRPPFRPLEGELRSVCEKALKLPASVDSDGAKKFFEENFRPVRISRLGERDGLLTGYYEPEVEGSRTRHGEFIYPLYKRPADLGARFSNRQAKRHRIGRAIGGYFDRAAIEAGALEGRGLEICWLKDQVDAFFIQVQGSARIRLEDGKVLRLNYDATNGYSYSSIGKVLIDRGIVPKEWMSLDAIRAYFAEEPDDAREIMNTNKSYVFFREIDLPPDVEPPGAQGVNLTAMRSIAVDKNLHIYGTPFWIEAMLPIESDRAETRFRRLMIAQDTGGAITGPARADLYFGGGLKAGTQAGRIKNMGTFYMLVPKDADPSKRIDPVPLPQPKPVVEKKPDPKAEPKTDGKAKASKS